MTLTAELYFSFRSPYSYLAVGRYRAMTANYDLDIALRPVWPLAIREPDFFERNHPNWLGYTMRDMLRVAQFHDIPFGAPRPDPIVQDVATRSIAADQPHIRRVTRMGQAAARRGSGLPFAHEAGQTIWGGQENWHEGDHLAARSPGLASTRRRSSAKSPRSPMRSTPRSPPTRTRSRRQVTGVCPPSCSTVNPSSGRTVSKWSAGEWTRRG